MKFEIPRTESIEPTESDQRLAAAYPALETLILIFDAKLELCSTAGEPDGFLPNIKNGASATELVLDKDAGTLADTLRQAMASHKPLDKCYQNHHGDSVFARCVALPGGSAALQLTRMPPPTITPDRAPDILAGCNDALQEFERMPPPHKLYVLIVDDDDDSRYIMINNLQSSNACQYSVAVAESSAKALEMLRENRFDVCITDFRLMDETAIELHRHSQSLVDPPPFIVVTNYPEDTLYAKLLNEGITDLMSKSEVTPELLSRSIRYAVQKHRLVANLKKQLSL